MQETTEKEMVRFTNFNSRTKMEDAMRKTVTEDEKHTHIKQKKTIRT